MRYSLANFLKVVFIVLLSSLESVVLLEYTRVASFTRENFSSRKGFLFSMISFTLPISSASLSEQIVSGCSSILFSLTRASPARRRNSPSFSLFRKRLLPAFTLLHIRMLKAVSGSKSNMFRLMQSDERADANIRQKSSRVSSRRKVS